MVTTVVRYVNTDSVGGDGTTNNTTGTDAAYSSLNGAVVAEAKDLVSADEKLIIYCDGTSADNYVGLHYTQGWIVDSTHYVTIQAHENSKTDGTWSTNKYRLTGSTSGTVAVINLPFTRFLNIQVQNTRLSGGNILSVSAPGAIVDSCHFYSYDTHYGKHTVFVIPDYDIPAFIPFWSAFNPTVFTNNRLAQLPQALDIRVDGFTQAFVANNTIGPNSYYYSTNWGIRYGAITSGESYLWLYNNITDRDEGEDAAVEIRSTFDCTIVTDANFTSDSSSPDGASYQNKTFTYTGSYANIMLSESDTSGAIGGGVNLYSHETYSFTTDMLSNARSASGGWTAGALELLLSASYSVVADGFYFLINDAGNNATTVGCISEGTQDSNYDENNLITGSRNEWFKTTSTADPKRMGYTWSNEIDIDHVIITRADKLVTSGSSQVNVQVNQSGWINLASSLDLENDLVGIKNQDYVLNYAPDGGATGVAVRVVPNSAEATYFNHLVGAVSFSFGRSPAFNVLTEELNPSDRYYTDNNTLPMRHRTYETSHRISMKFEHVTKAKLDEFLALDNIRNHPLYIYDSNAWVFPHKLEHVILESIKTTQDNKDLWTISLVFRRLRHYD